MRPPADLIIYEEDLSRINDCLATLHGRARSTAVLLIDTGGQLIASAGDTDGLDTTPLASLAAGSMAAAGALAKLLGEKEFSFIFYDGERRRLHLSVIGGRAILLVVQEHYSAVALVRLQVKRFSREIEAILKDLSQRPERAPGKDIQPSRPAVGEISDDDVENLFDKG